MRFELPPLPYPKDALAPHVSAETVDVHYEKHHQGYLKKLYALLSADPARRDLPLEEIIITAEAGPVFDNAAQVWNHTFYWQSMKPARARSSREWPLTKAIRPHFGSKANFVARFADVAEHHFGSGYVWLAVARGSEEVVLEALPNAQTPLTRGLVPILCLDIWEHAYYLDRRNDRTAYIRAFLEHVANWEFAAANFDAVHSSSATTRA